MKLDAARFRTAFGRAEPGPSGIDRVEYEVSTNPGAPFGPLTKIASGGELSRFILALKVALAEAGGAATMIFDEVDRGVGGAVASAIGERLARLSAQAQVLVVTHSPQVAARATHHYRIEKTHDGLVTRTSVRRLDGAERREEIARMLSGAAITDEARAQAAKLIGGSMTEQRSLKQEYKGQTLDHVIVHDETGRVLPTVIIIPTVMGVQPLEIGFAEKLVELGYHAVIADLFGRRFTPGVDKEAAFAAMGELRADRAALRDRLLAVLGEVRKREHVDKERIAVIGYCFGGQCALDVARSGADVAGVAAFHGLFDPPGLPPVPIKAKVAAYHGWNDPMVPPEAVVALGQ